MLNFSELYQIYEDDCVILSCKVEFLEVFMEDKNKNIIVTPLSKGEPIRGEAGISGFSPFGWEEPNPITL